jgi:hypothetical protein
MWLRPGALTTGSWSDYRYVGLVGDWDGDGAGDLAGISEDRLWIFPGVGKGAFAAPIGWLGGASPASGASPLQTTWTATAAPTWSAAAAGDVWLHRGLGVDGRRRAGAAARREPDRPTPCCPQGFWNGDDTRDVVAVVDGAPQLWAGHRRRWARCSGRPDQRGDLGRYRRLSGAGDLSGDGHPDLLAVTATGTAYILPGSFGASARRYGSRETGADSPGGRAWRQAA